MSGLAEGTPSHDRAGMALELRPARFDDEAMILGWRNDPLIIERSSSRRGVSPDEHHAWFSRALRSDDCRLLIVLVGGEPAGLVRFDRTADEALISAYLLGRFTGRGFGPRAIHAASAAVQREWPVEIVAHVRGDNHAGRAAFAKAGFEAVAVPQPPAGHVVFALRRGRE